MFDWTKLCNSGRDMSGTKGKLLKITAQELAQHSTDEDLWTAVRGTHIQLMNFFLVLA